MRQIDEIRRFIASLNTIPGGSRMKTINLTNTTRVAFREYRKTATIKAGKIPIAFTIDTLEGTFTGKPGDWLTEGVEGERYIIDDEIFRKTYEEVK